MKVYSVSLPEDLVAWVDMRRRDTGQSRSDLIRCMIEAAKTGSDCLKEVKRLMGSLARDSRIVAAQREWLETSAKLYAEKIAPVLVENGVVPALPPGTDLAGELVQRVQRRARFQRAVGPVADVAALPEESA
jgi:hypothetical protein